MADFGSGQWPSGFGALAYYNSAGYRVPSAVENYVTPTATATGSTEGTNMWTFTCPTAGLYRVESQAMVAVASDAVTSDALTFTYTHTRPGTTASPTPVTSAMLPQTNGSLAVTASTGTVAVSRSILRCTAGSQIIVKMVDTVTGAKTAGSVHMYVSAEKIAD